MIEQQSTTQLTVLSMSATVIVIQLAATIRNTQTELIVQYTQLKQMHSTSHAPSRIQILRIFSIQKFMNFKSFSDTRYAKAISTYLKICLNS